MMTVMVIMMVMMMMKVITMKVVMLVMVMMVMTVIIFMCVFLKFKRKRKEIQSMCFLWGSLDNNQRSLELFLLVYGVF